jgi:hypothetical protein
MSTLAALTIIHSGQIILTGAYPRLVIVSSVSILAPFIQPIIEYKRNQLRISIVAYLLVTMILFGTCIYFFFSNNVGGPGLAFDLFLGAISPAVTIFPIAVLIKLKYTNKATGADGV